MLKNALKVCVVMVCVGSLSGCIVAAAGAGAAGGYLFEKNYKVKKKEQKASQESAPVQSQQANANPDESKYTL